MDRAAHASPRMICIMAALLAFAATAPAHPILDTPDDRAEVATTGRWPRSTSASRESFGNGAISSRRPRGHNPELQARAAAGDLAWSAVLDFLDRRVGLLDAVVFSGGEPTLQPGLARAVEEVRRRGFAAGLHTAGIYPRRLAQALPRLDWVGLDIKAGFGAYERVIGRRAGASAARDSLELLVASGVPHEVRTTWHPDLLGAADLLQMARDLARRGVRHFALQVIAPAPPQADVLACLRALFEAFTLRHSAAAAWGAR